jgi:hypothetical protein
MKSRLRPCSTSLKKINNTKFTTPRPATLIDVSKHSPTEIRTTLPESNGNEDDSSEIIDRILANETERQRPQDSSGTLQTSTSLTYIRAE